MNNLLEPFQLKHLTLRNRIVSTSHAPNFVQGGHPRERYRLYHGRKGKGWCGAHDGWWLYEYCTG